MRIDFNRRSDGSADFSFVFTGYDWAAIFTAVGIILITILCFRYGVGTPTNKSVAEESESQISAEITETIENDATPEASEEPIGSATFQWSQFKELYDEHGDARAREYVATVGYTSGVVSSLYANSEDGFYAVNVTENEDELFPNVGLWISYDDYMRIDKGDSICAYGSLKVNGRYSLDSKDIVEIVSISKR